MIFTPLRPAEREALLKALDRNADHKGGLLTNRDTSFAGAVDDIPDEEVITAIKSTPCHY